MSKLKQMWWRWFPRTGDAIHRKLDREIDEELSFHIEMRIRDNIEAGMTPEEARRQAHRRLGDLGTVRRDGEEIRRRGERHRGIRRILADLRQDLRFAVHTMVASPGMTAIAVLALMLGIGATTSVFSVVDGVLLQELPYEDPGRLVFIGSRVLDRDTEDAFKAAFETLEESAFFTIDLHEMVGPEGARVGSSLSASERFFPVLGVRPARGRTFGADDFRSDAPPTAVITDRLWRDFLSADPEGVGSTITLDAVPHTVIGVMPPGFTILHYSDTDIFLPLTYAGNDVRMAIGRLREGVSLEHVRGEAAGLAATFDVDAQEGEQTRISVTTLYEATVGGDRTDLSLIAGAASLVLLIACANVANLLLARALNRQAEISVRAALGASRWRLVRQLLTESGLLALCGGVLGVLVAARSVPAVLAMSPVYLSRTDNVGIDWRVLVFALAVSLATGVLFGLAPVLLVGSRDLKRSMIGGGNRTSGSRAGRRALNGLVVAEVALSLVLLIGTGLLVRAFLEMRPAAPGFDPDGKLIFEVRPPEQRYPDPASRARFYDRVLSELRAHPGVENAAAISSPPMIGMVWMVSAIPEGTDPTTEDLPTVWYERASGNYHEVMGIAMRRGRALAAARPQAAREMVISEQAAGSLWPDQEPLGKRITVKNPGGDERFVVVGVAADTRRLAGSKRPRPTVWVRYQDDPDDRMVFVVQARGRPGELAVPVRELIADLDPELPIMDLQTMGQLLYDSMKGPRFYMMLMGAFGSIAILLAAIGFYGVMAYAVSRRTHELGIRVVLGASPASIRWMVLRQGTVIVAAGVVIGLAGCLALTRWLESLLFGISPTDPATYAVLVGVVVALGLLASYFPARRATRVDPLEAVRSQ